MSAVFTVSGSVQLSGFDLFSSLTPAYSLYTISVRQTRVLPPPSFGFHLAMDTLGFGCILPTAGRIRDFHPLERALAGRTKNRTRWNFRRVRCYNMCFIVKKACLLNRRA